MGMICPPARTGLDYVFIDEAAVATASRAARNCVMGVVAQVHSHPGEDTRHSDGDDRLVMMPFEGMFSLVVAAYGSGGLHPNSGAGLHQYQDQQWVQLINTDAMVIVPASVGDWTRPVRTLLREP
jgi:proteasome lid subunit RPN8/RPN11